MRQNFVGFSGVAPIAMALEYVLGLSITPEGLHWNIHLQQRHGVENFHVLGQKVDLAWENGQATICCQAPLTIFLNGKAYSLPAGCHTLSC